MQSSVNRTSTARFRDVLQELFFQRSLICLWLAVVFFSLFSLLDFVYSYEDFKLFLLYRMIFVTFLLSCINILRIPSARSLVPHIMVSGMLFGAFIIALMTVRLGGFYSGYYVGILLMIAGGISGLPLTGWQASFIGLGMYIVYIVTVLIGTGNTDTAHLIYGMNNSFFFLAIVAVTALQSYDDIRSLSKEHKAKLRLNKLHRKLSTYSNNLEDAIQKRLAELEDSNLRYQDLYNHIQDLILLVDTKGTVHKVNNLSQAMLGLPPEKLRNSAIREIVRTEGNGRDWFGELVEQLNGTQSVQGLQLSLCPPEGQKRREVEVSASSLDMDNTLYFQLIIRDISTTKTMEKKLLDSQRLLGTSRQAAIFGLAKLAECRDNETGSHLNRIRTYSRFLAMELAKKSAFANVITRSFVDDLYYSSVLHDIGKVGIPDRILLKPGRLTEQEFELMKQHTIFGSDVLVAAEKDLDSLSFLYTGQEIARSHHERWDATGYPDGLADEQIPLAARILSLADVYDALTSARVYKPSYSHEESMEIISDEREKQFDPRIVDAFLQNGHIFKETRIQLLQQPESRYENDSRVH